MRRCNLCRGESEQCSGCEIEQLQKQLAKKQKAIDEYYAVCGEIGEILRIEGGWHVSALPDRVKMLAADADKSKEHRGQLLGEMRWIGQQPCRYEAEGSDESRGMPCTETGACVTEYCFPCYAKMVVRAFDE